MAKPQPETLPGGVGPDTKGAPMTPKEVMQYKHNTVIPGYVYDAFNFVIAQELVNGKALFTKKRVVEEILIRASITEGEVHKLRLLDAYEAYAARGWQVTVRVDDDGVGWFTFAILPSWPQEESKP